MPSRYISELATQAFDPINAQKWEEFKRISRYLAQRPDNTLQLEQELELHTRLQAELAWHLGYTPSKWLLENELEEINARREKSDIARLDSRGNWQAPNAEEIREWEKKQDDEWEKKTGVKVPPKSNDTYERAARSGLTGICFSGGGIRSATINLGILQGLAELKLLGCFDYLSSVSGGGYIHQFLAAWTSRNGFATVAKDLIPLPEKDSPSSHPETIRWLRRYSNYLTPEKSLLSLDTWVTVAIWLRNTLLNQIILISGLLFIMLLPHLFTFNWFVPSRHWSVMAAIAVIVYLFLAAVAFLGGELSLLQYTPDPAASASQSVLIKFMDQSGVQIWLVLPLLLASILITLLFPIGAMGIDFLWAWILVPILYLVLTLTITFAGGTLAAYLKTHHLIGLNEKAKDFWSRATWSCPAYWRFLGVVALLVLAALLVAIGGAGWHLLMRVMTVWLPHSLAGHLWRFELTFAPPLLMMGPLLAGIILIGFIGRIFKDSRREWLGRIGACVGYDAVIWIVLVGGSLFGSVILKWLTCKLWAGIPALVAWLGTSGWSVLAGKSDKTAGAKDDKAPSKFSVLEIVAKVGPYVFVAGLLILLSALAECLIGWAQPGGLALFLVFVIPLAICALFTWRVDINEFSMHAYYRDRLARCYLGASNADRKPNPFTGFDDEDSNIAVSHLTASQGYLGPYPIFCTTLNLTFGEDLAWQERKGASFVFAPVLSGYDVGWTEAKDQKEKLRFNGFVETATYAYASPGIHVSTAAAISGAALSPNWGYHTDPATAFLLTVFNVRLGWWLRNPRTVAQDGKILNDPTKAGHDAYPWPSPRFSLVALSKELFGHTNDTTKYLYLTDGGHFDNMGLYELVRRRCRYIVICDGEEDGQLRFEGIGMAIRKCRIDFGAEISLDLRPLYHIDGVNSTAHCVVGTITYQEDAIARKPGIVVYIKSSLTGDEPADLVNYKKEDPCFPHDSTLNQWFTESQFESYRRLGHHIAYSTFEPARPGSNDCTDIMKRDTYFGILRGIWYARTPEMDRHSAEHSKRYEALLRRIRKDERLPGFFEKLFTPAHTPLADPKWKWKSNRSPAEIEHAHAISSDLIEFIFLVYLELNLVFPEKRNHPFAQGWYAIFRTWSKIDVVQDGWRIFSHGYSRSFRLFAQSELGFSET